RLVAAERVFVPLAVPADVALAASPNLHSPAGAPSERTPDARRPHARPGVRTAARRDGNRSENCQKGAGPASAESRNRRPPGPDTSGSRGPATAPAGGSAADAGDELRRRGESGGPLVAAREHPGEAALPGGGIGEGLDPAAGAIADDLLAHLQVHVGVGGDLGQVGDAED